MAADVRVPTLADLERVNQKLARANRDLRERLRIAESALQAQQSTAGILRRVALSGSRPVQDAPLAAAPPQYVFRLKDGPSERPDGAKGSR